MKRHIKRSEVMRWRLREVRLERGLSLRDVGKTIHYSYVTIARAERGVIYNTEKPTKSAQEFWRIISDFYGVPEEELKKKETRA